MKEIKANQAGTPWKHELSRRLMGLSIHVIKLTDEMSSSFSARHIAKQLLRSATSSGTNYEEACGAESRADFIHKMQVVLKELKETLYWFDLVEQAGLLSEKQMAPLHAEAQELASIVAKSVLTAKNKAQGLTTAEKGGRNKK